MRSHEDAGIARNGIAIIEMIEILDVANWCFAPGKLGVCYVQNVGGVTASGRLDHVDHGTVL